MDEQEHKQNGIPAEQEVDCGCGHDHDERSVRPAIIRIAVGTALTLAASLLPQSGWTLPLYLAAYLIAGCDVVLEAFRNLFHGKVFDENFLMTVASAGAFATGETREAVMVMLLYQLGELLHTRAAARSREAIEALSARDSADGEVRMFRLSGAPAGRAKSETFIRRFSRVYTPVVTGLAVLVAVLPPLLGAGSWHDWLYRGLVVLVASCPCALVISIPLGLFSGMGGATRDGILFRGGGALEALAKGASAEPTLDRDEADLTLTGDGSMDAALAIARRTMRILNQNVAFILTVKIVVLVLGALGYSPMWLAVFADAGVALLAVLNSVRCFRRRSDS